MNGTSSSWYWLIASCEPTQMEILTIRIGGGAQALPVFSFEEEAKLFLKRRTFEDGWQIRLISAEELASVLLGPCENVAGIALDPFPEVSDEMLASLVCAKREDFAELLLRRYVRSRSRCRRGSTGPGCVGEYRSYR